MGHVLEVLCVSLVKMMYKCVRKGKCENKKIMWRGEIYEALYSIERHDGEINCVVDKWCENVED